MPIRVFTVPYDPAQRRFVDDELADALQGCRVLSLAEHAFTVDGGPLLALTVRYEAPPAAPGAGRPAAPPQERGADSVADVDQPLFEALRAWRNARARRDGRPAYVLFTNAQLVEVATRRPTTRAELQAIDGIGEARVQGYADEVLGLVARTPRGAPAAEGGDVQQPG